MWPGVFTRNQVEVCTSKWLHAVVYAVNISCKGPLCCTACKAEMWVQISYNDTQDGGKMKRKNSALEIDQWSIVQHEWNDQVYSMSGRAVDITTGWSTFFAALNTCLSDMVKVLMNLSQWSHSSETGVGTVSALLRRVWHLGLPSLSLSLLPLLSPLSLHFQPNPLSISLLFL